MRLALALFLFSLASGENSSETVLKEEGDLELLSRDLSENEGMSSAASIEFVETNNNLTGSGLRGTHSTTDVTMEVDQHHRATAIKYKVVGNGSSGGIGVSIQDTCNILKNQALVKRTGVHDTFRAPGVVFSKQFNGQTLWTERAVINASDQLTDTVARPLTLVQTDQKVFVHNKCTNGSCGVTLEVKGESYKGEGCISMRFRNNRRKVTLTMESYGAKSLTAICYDQNGNVIGKKNKGTISNNGDTKIILTRKEQADIRGISLCSTGNPFYFLRKFKLKGVCHQ